MICVAGSAFSSGLAALTHPVKLRLSRAAGVDAADLRDYSANVVLIEPLATMTAVEDFLAPRIRPVPAAPAAATDASNAEVQVASSLPAITRYVCLCHCCRITVPETLGVHHAEMVDICIYICSSFAIWPAHKPSASISMMILLCLFACSGE